VCAEEYHDPIEDSIHCHRCEKWWHKSSTTYE